MKLENKLNEYDCLAFDGGYYYYIDKFLENCDKKGNDKINNSNFMFPIRKKINEDLTDDEILYNETFGSFRNIKLYNIQLKLSLLLLNIQRFCSLYNIPLKPNHLLWANDNFNYPNPKNNLIDNIIYKFDILKLTEMSNRQSEFINNYFDCNENQSIRLNEIEMEIENDDDDENFEVEKILDHRKFKKRMKFLIKWKNYDETYNEWIWQEDFNETFIIDEYLASINF
ncbi:uncharacterized protein B0P05DRAFT_619074 [Gilbertella persicaria]|uniref:uncharacterized protein n=1 Tax=Gilbertella persicaria TaxID=101096 RepID=UPI00221FFCD2|nr:uncharacterized protein B0P05DRAFT_619074 [Gilbertella persicaria]KAI8071097.1 hypothetical protein B0P05DRAFT_619074 [Gilbertella persicaria]